MTSPKWVELWPLLAALNIVALLAWFGSRWRVVLAGGRRARAVVPTMPNEPAVAVAAASTIRSEPTGATADAPLAASSASAGAEARRFRSRSESSLAADLERFRRKVAGRSLGDDEMGGVRA